MIVFSGNLNLLIAAPMLQDSFVDKDGSPMSAGTITCYHDNSRTTLKNWYYQTGSGGNYIYIALPNPLTLSAAGTICDINGVDTIPFFYPYDETDTSPVPANDAYYITIVNHDQTNQITRENFPFVPPAGNALETINSFNNLIINNGFWRNILPNATNITPFSSFTFDSTTLSQSLGGGNFYAVVAPSQHDGFRMPDIQYQQAILTGSNNVTFTPFPLGSSQPVQNTPTNSPEYYISHVCSSAGSGQTQKCYQFPISLHLNSIANLPFTISIQAQNGGGTSPGANLLTLFLLQDTGTGGTPVAPIELIQFTLNTSWQQYTFSDFLPATSGLNLGTGADDAWYLQVQMPLNSLCTINFTKPCFYLTQNVVPTIDYRTYDQVDTVINSPRTGDVRTTINSFYNFGWLPMADGTIGNASSNATIFANVETWPLYNLLWSNFYQYSVGTGSSGTNSVVQMYNSANSPVAYGPSISGSGSAIADWNSNKAIALTKALGQVLTGTVPPNAKPDDWFGTFTASNSGGNLLITWQWIAFTGCPIIFSNAGGALPTGLSPNTVYYAVIASNNDRDNIWYVATSLANAYSGTVISYTNSGSGTNSAESNLLGVQYGQYGHVQLATEVGAHTHPASTAMALNISNVASGGLTNFVAGSATSATTTVPPFASGSFTTVIGANTGNKAFNVMQPSTWYNIFIKL